MYGGDSETPVRAGDAWLTRIFDVSQDSKTYSYSLPLQFEVKHTLDGLVIAQSWATLRTNSFWYYLVSKDPVHGILSQMLRREFFIGLTQLYIGKD